MLAIVFAMLTVLIAAAVVFVYVAFPHRDQDVPGAPWLGDAMKRGVESLPTLDAEAGSRGVGLTKFTQH